MKRVIIIGLPRADKSTFSRELNAITEIPLFHMDKLFWKAGWKSIEIKELYCLTLSRHSEVFGAKIS